MIIQDWKTIFGLFRLSVFDEDQAGDNGDGDDGDNGGSEEGGGQNRPLTQADVDAAVSSALARERKKSEKKSREAAEAARLQAMTEAERQAERLKTLEATVTALQAEKARATMAGTVRGMLSQAGVTGYTDDMVDALVVADDADATKARVQSFTAAYKAAVAAGIAASVKGTTPRVTGTGKPAGGMSKEDILKIEDPLERQKAIRANINLFK